MISIHHINAQDNIIYRAILNLSNSASNIVVLTLILNVALMNEIRFQDIYILVFNKDNIIEEYDECILIANSPSSKVTFKKLIFKF